MAVLQSEEPALIPRHNCQLAQSRSGSIQEVNRLIVSRFTRKGLPRLGYLLFTASDTDPSHFAVFDCASSYENRSNERRAIGLWPQNAFEIIFVTKNGLDLKSPIKMNRRRTENCASFEHPIFNCV